MWRGINRLITTRASTSTSTATPATMLGSTNRKAQNCRSTLFLGSLHNRLRVRSSVVLFCACRVPFACAFSVIRFPRTPHLFLYSRRAQFPRTPHLCLYLRRSRFPHTPHLFLYPLPLPRVISRLSPRPTSRPFPMSSHTYIAHFCD